MALMNAKEAKELFYQKEEQVENDLINYLSSEAMEEHFNSKIKLAIEKLSSEIYISFINKIIDNNNYNKQTIRNYFKRKGYKVCNFYIIMNQIWGVTIQIPLNH